MLIEFQVAFPLLLQELIIAPASMLHHVTWHFRLGLQDVSVIFDHQTAKYEAALFHSMLDWPTIAIAYNSHIFQRVPLLNWSGEWKLSSVAKTLDVQNHLWCSEGFLRAADLAMLSAAFAKRFQESYSRNCALD